jgi:hypothetical protein
MCGCPKTVGGSCSTQSSSNPPTTVSGNRSGDLSQTGYEPSRISANRRVTERPVPLASKKLPLSTPKITIDVVSRQSIFFYRFLS